MDTEDPILVIERKTQVLLAENKTSVAKLCEGIGMTANGYSKMWKNRSIKVETIQKIADYFNISISYFFSESESSTYEISSSNSGVEEMREKYIKALESENRLLKRLLDEKEQS